MKPEKFAIDHPPRMPAGPGREGPIIRSVRLLRAKQQSGITITRGDSQVHADLDSMCRVDVFAKAGKFYLVPIYAYQIGNPRDFPEPPCRAVIAHKPESQWVRIDESFEFRFSLYPGSFVEAIDRKGVVHEGYYRGIDRRTASMTFSPHWNHDLKAQQRVGTKTLSSFRKYQVDRLGNRSLVKKETRVWRGEAWSSANGQDSD